MNTTPRTGISHPLVVAYVDDLDRALESADQQERLDIIAAVREHLTDALGGDAEATNEQVRAALDELGPIEHIAAEATPAATTPASALPAEKVRDGGWVAPALLATSIVSLVIPFLGALLAIGCIATAVVLLRSGSPRRPLLHATVAVSIVTLVITAVLAAGTLAFSTLTTEGPSVSSSADPLPSVVVTIPSQP